MHGPHRVLPAFVSCSIALGCVAFVTIGEGWQQAQRQPQIAVVLAGLLLVTELMPVTLPFRRGKIEVATSTTFTLALLLYSGIGPALAAQVLASIAADLFARKDARKVAFNAAQFAIAIGAAGTVLTQLGGQTILRGGLLEPGEIGPVAAAAVVFFVANNLMVWVVVSLATGSSLRRRVADEWVFDTASSLVLIGLAPVVDLVAVKALWMLPLLLIPVGAVYLTARSSVAQEHQALHDGLTGLANRTRFRAEVLATLEESGRMLRPLAVLLIDLDRFKEINDTLGHHTGDVLLRNVGPRLASSSEAVTLVARFGGDEFAVLLADIDGPDQAIEVARELTRALEVPFMLDDGLMLEIEASIGVVVTPEHGGDVDVLLQRADVAMYLAKAAKTGVALYAPERDDNTRRRLTLIGQLRAAITNDELVLHYQPKLEVATNSFTGVEALVRWSHPEMGLLPPSEFIPLAERSGLIKPLTRFVLQTAMAQAQRWHRDGLALRVAVNLSARTFLDFELPAMVAGLLAEAGMDPSWLELEITETELMADPAHGAKVLDRLHAMGVRLTIDDFGTGHSSLAYLSRLPVDEIKIDRCFVAEMAADDISAGDIIVRSTIELVRNLGLEVTAEGVETAAQLERLTVLGCHFLQGYFLSRPVPADELFTFLSAASALASRVSPSRSRSELMLIVAVFVIGLIALRLNGSVLTQLNNLRIRWPLLAVGAVIAQVVIISLWPDGWHIGHLIVHLGTYAALGVFLWVNRGISWLWVVALGTASNAAAIAFNGGVMPASATALTTSHLRAGPGFANSAAVAHPRLGFLGDVIATPSWLPLHNVASIGDLLIAGGALLVVAHQTRRTTAAVVSHH